MTFIHGDNISLRAVTRKDLPTLQRWRNDAELRARTREFRPLTELDQERWFERISGPNRKDYMFVVCDAKHKYAPIGVVGLCHHDAINRRAEVSFYIGEQQARGKGYASEALRLLHQYGFGELNLHKITAEVFDFNSPSQKLLEKLGYIVEGRLKDHIWHYGWCDSILMGLFKHNA